VSPAARPTAAPVQVWLAKVAIIERVGRQPQVVPGVAATALPASLADTLQLEALLVLAQEELVPLVMNQT
jgi:hypothetical protein